MTAPQPPATRGRPRTITRERIVEAGIKIGLPSITFVGVAAALGVSHMALYKHVANLEALKSMVAEEIFTRWQIPKADAAPRSELKDYMVVFAASVQVFVKAHPGLTPYVIRRLAATQPMLAKIDEHQSHIAEVYGLSKDHVRWLLATVAFHGIAVADTVYSVTGREPVLDADSAAEEAEMEAELAHGMHALIVGALVLLKEWVSDAAQDPVKDFQ
ncbi:TetR family transcriptional regulator [Pseudomonas endophytica]|uniref:TetR family transcriptional regulator n=1 Tax=Pseudomonas endophytica TaxID=1563157 RepID=A0A0Q0X1F3_9PSED|nr:TetR/AcrR family transcriptional regulator [Pseudomonas endophytica]KQB53545.1 TetR family transcriptional regulator [Pseudomonas endophytica]